jgi:hypothetical protein
MTIIDILAALESETGIDISEMSVIANPDGKRVLKEISNGKQKLYIVTDYPRKSTTEVAKILGIDISRVLRIRASRKLGERRGREWYFSESEIDNMRIRNPGKPKTSRPPD